MLNFWAQKQYTGCLEIIICAEFGDYCFNLCWVTVQKDMQTNMTKTQPSLTNRATHLCKCNDVDDLLKHAPHPYVLPRRIWSFYVQGCRHKEEYPKNLCGWGPASSVGRVRPLQTRIFPCGLPCRTWQLLVKRYEHTYGGLSEKKLGSLCPAFQCHSRSSELTLIAPVYLWLPNNVP